MVGDKPGTRHQLVCMLTLDHTPFLAFGQWGPNKCRIIFDHQQTDRGESISNLADIGTTQTFFSLLIFFIVHTVSSRAWLGTVAVGRTVPRISLTHPLVPKAHLSLMFANEDLFLL